MVNDILAGLVVAAHFAWIMFLILGLPVFMYFNLRRWRIFHLTALAGTVAMQVTGTACPLTCLESALRSKSQGSVYPGQFITECLESIIYVDGHTLEKVQALTVLFLAGTALSFFFRPPRRKKSPAGR